METEYFTNGTNGNGHTGAESSGQQTPEPDAIKMFVGQVPRNMDETELKRMFEEYGPVHQLNVLRDKTSGQSKGCCFVTFYTRKAAMDAQMALHNIKILPGMHHPVQMKPADSENRSALERKLFVGMINKKASEGDIRLMFAAYGTVEDCTILRDPQGNSKGCAFVTYTSRNCAVNAIKALHHTQTMEGCTMPLVVKFADTQKEKDQKKAVLHQQLNLGGLVATPPAALGHQLLASSAPTSNLTSQYLNLLQQSQQGASLNNNASLQQLLLLAAAASATSNTQQSNLFGLNSLTGHNTALPNSATAAQSGLNGLAALASVLLGSTANKSQTGMNSVGLQNLSALTGSPAQTMSPAPNTQNTLVSLLNALVSQNASSGTGSNSTSGLGAYSASNAYDSLYGGGRLYASPAGSLAQVAGTNGLSGLTSFGGGGLSMGTLGGLASANPVGTGLDMSQAYSAGLQQFAAAAFPSAFSQQNVQVSSTVGKQTDGPDGANLFIYHLPQEYTDSDLAQTFMPFGNVISAKVFIDKQTNLSKCFGFVSYDNPSSASSAIQAMNGFQVGTKRLKVQLKRSKHDAKPYQHPGGVN